MQWVGWFAVAVGVFAVCGGVFNWDWYMDLPRARLWVKLLGRAGARILFVVLGALVGGGGAFLLTRP